MPEEEGLSDKDLQLPEGTIEGTTDGSVGAAGQLAPDTGGGEFGRDASGASIVDNIVEAGREMDAREAEQARARIDADRAIFAQKTPGEIQNSIALLRQAEGQLRKMSDEQYLTNGDTTLGRTRLEAIRGVNGTIETAASEHREKTTGSRSMLRDRKFGK